MYGNNTLSLLMLISILCLLCTCGPASPAAAEEDREVEREYTWVSGRPPLTFSSQGEYPGYRARLADDSIYIFDPFSGASGSYVAYPAGQSGSIPDRTHAIYSFEEDSTLLVTVENWTEAGGVRFRPVERLEYGPLPRSVVGKTYRFEMDSLERIVYFKPIPLEGPRQMLIAHVVTVTDEVGADPLSYDMGFQSDKGTIRLHMRKKDGSRKPLERSKITLLSGAVDSTLQLHTLDMVDGKLYGPKVLMPYPSPVPDSVTNGELWQILNTGRIEVGKLSPEPDSLGIAYVTDPNVATNGLVRREELDQLDFEFAQDGNWTTFIGDRVVHEGKWTFTEDRHFIDITSGATINRGVRLITDYGEGRLSFTLPLRVQTQQPRGVELVSYYTPEVPLTFRKVP